VTDVNSEAGTVLEQSGAHSGSSSLSTESRWTSTTAIVLYLAGLKLLLELFAANSYGYFRDELYFLALAKRPLSWGYVDLPPFLIVVTKLIVATIGDSKFAIRLFPAVCGALKVILAAALAREMGGRRIAPIFAALAVLSTGVFWGIDHILSMNTFEQLLWGTCALIVVKIVNGDDHRWWLGFGLLSGIGILNKYSMVFFGFAMVVGILLTPLRTSLLSKWFWIAGGIAGLMALPNFLWQMHHGFPFLELMENIKRSGRDVALSPLAFIKQQIMMLNPAVAPVWLTGLIWVFVSKRGRRYRVLGIAFLVVLALMMALHGKDYYVAPAYVMLFAAGAVAFEIGWERLPLRIAVIAACVLMVASWVTMPLGMPLMSPERFVAYKKALNLDLKESENHRQNELGQFYADHFGWPEMTEQVAKAYNRIPPELRKKTAIKTDNYGEAGAIDHFGKKYGLPLAISGHQNYWIWGPGDWTGESLLLLGEGEPESLPNKCAQVTPMGQVGTKWSIPYEHFTIYWCRGLKAPLKDIWPQVKNWN
jgi:hypothetical protein